MKVRLKWVSEAGVFDEIVDKVDTTDPTIYTADGQELVGFTMNDLTSSNWTLFQDQDGIFRIDNCDILSCIEVL